MAIDQSEQARGFSLLLAMPFFRVLHHVSGLSIYKEDASGSEGFWIVAARTRRSWFVPASQ
jgi:hypothetical protein